VANLCRACPPARRQSELSDDLHDICGTIEREGGNHVTSEVGLRERIRLISSGELAARRVELQAAARAVDHRLAVVIDLDGQSGTAGLGRAARSSARRLRRWRTRAPKSLARVRTAEAVSADWLRRDLAELAVLSVPDAAAEPSRSIRQPDLNRP
jgi:hypothetical protein